MHLILKRAKVMSTLERRDQKTLQLKKKHFIVKIENTKN